MKTPEQTQKPADSGIEETEKVETKEQWSQKLIDDCENLKKFAEQQQTAEYASEGPFNSFLGSIRHRFLNPKFDIDAKTAETCLQILKEAQELSKNHPAKPDKLFINVIEAIERNKV